MADVTLLNIVEGVRTTWDASGPLSTLVPSERLYLGRAPADTEYPYAVMEFKDISAFFGGTEYFSGSTYVKTTQVNLAVYGDRNVNWKGVAQYMSDAFGWSSTNVPGPWVIENATILSAMPEVEGLEVLPERVNGEDMLKYSSSFTVAMQAERG